MRETDFTPITYIMIMFMSIKAQAAITCSKLTKETVEQGVKYVQS